MFLTGPIDKDIQINPCSYSRTQKRPFLKIYFFFVDIDVPLEKDNVYFRYMYILLTVLTYVNVHIKKTYSV